MKPFFNDFFPSKKQWFSSYNFCFLIELKDFFKLIISFGSKFIPMCFHIKSNIHFMPIMQQSDEESLKSFNIFSMKFFYSFSMSVFYYVGVTYYISATLHNGTCKHVLSYPTQNCNQCNVNKFHHLNFLLVVLV